MPLPFALPIGLLVGLSLAWLSRAELARSEVPLALARPFLVAVGLGIIVYAPVLGYFAAAHGDWTYLYLFRSSRVPSALDLAFVVACGASVPAGFALATPWAIAKRSQRLLAASAALAAAVVIGAVLASRRLATSASYAQFHGGFGGAPASHTTLGRGVLSSWIAFAAAYAWSAWVLRSARAPRGGS